MNEYTLKPSSETISGLSLGSWGMSGASVWGTNEEAASIRTIHAALDYGINLIDSAEAYGNGEAERVLGKAIRDRRSNILIATKVTASNMGSPQQIRDSCENSLRIMKLNEIDIYQIHWPSPENDYEEILATFETLQKEGKIRYISVCNFGYGALKEIEGRNDILMNQMPYSLIWRQAEDIIETSYRDYHLPTWAYSPLAQGLLTGKFKTLDDVPTHRRSSRFYDGTESGSANHGDTGFESEIFAYLDTLRELERETGYTMLEMALAFLRTRETTASILAGARSEKQLQELVEAYEKNVPGELITELVNSSEKLKEQMGPNPDMWNAEGERGRFY